MAHSLPPRLRRKASPHKVHRILTKGRLGNVFERSSFDPWLFKLAPPPPRHNLASMIKYDEQAPLTPPQPLPENPGSISRRSFLGTAAGGVGAASLGWVGATPSTVTAAEAAQDGTGRKDIRIGMMTAPVSHLPLDAVLDMAKRCGMAALEIMSGPGSSLIDPMNFSQADAEAVKQKLADRQLEISSLANYMNSAAPGKTDEVQTIAKKMIDAAALLEVPTICMITGLPHQGMSRIAMIKQVVPTVFRPIVDHAKEKGIHVAVENWFATCLQGLDTFDCLMETIPDENFGLNYDPSHLVHQELDIMIPVTRFGKRIFHTHAKGAHSRVLGN